MKALFNCNMCRESFNVADEYLVNKNSVICPNCSSEFPEQSFELLKQGISFISESRSEMNLENTKLGYTHRFDFTIID